ncbi:MAG: glycoside hydrolase family 97 N-terminal domain-containing protein, partial [Bacteroidales bacterium]|nr:glycoside hydrolase family 97 N-terminal domain-containing protein [Bacteroidales bacterium]
MKIKYYYLLPLIILTLNFGGCSKHDKTLNTIISSPSKNILVEFLLKQDGTPCYIVKHEGKIVIDTSSMGFEFQKQASLIKGFDVIDKDIKSHSETWEMPWGEQRKVSNCYNELIVNLRESAIPNRMLNIYFRAYDDGMAFRYVFPEQEGVDEVIITDENTQFNLTGDHSCWWIPGDWDLYEHLYNTTRFTGIDAISKRNHPNLNATYIPENAVNTPVTMKTDDGLYLSFHEANLMDYAGMTLKVDKDKLLMQSELVGSDITGYKVKRTLPFKTPWRTVQIAKKAGDLIESNLIVNLNEPNKIGDVSWFTPMKYMGIWWEMHLGISTWDYGATQDMSTFIKKKVSSSKHGATNENAKKIIDFASQNNIKGLLIEGW